MNKVILIGRLTADPECNTTQNGTTVAKYRLAVDRQNKKEGNPTADFIPCVAFGNGGDFAKKYLHKGLRIAIEGRIQTGSYEAQDGTKRYTTEVWVDRHEFCESKGSGRASAPETDMTPVEDEDWPF